MSSSVYWRWCDGGPVQKAIEIQRNGAGKTTTINMLTGLARPDAGTIRIADIDCSMDPKAAQLFGISLRNIRRKWIA